MLDLILQACQLVDDFLSLFGRGWVLGLGGGSVDIVDGLGLMLRGARGQLVVRLMQIARGEEEGQTMMTGHLSLAVDQPNEVLSPVENLAARVGSWSTFASRGIRRRSREMAERTCLGVELHPARTAEFQLASKMPGWWSRRKSVDVLG